MSSHGRLTIPSSLLWLLLCDVVSALFVVKIELNWVGLECVAQRVSKVEGLEALSKLFNKIISAISDDRLISKVGDS